MVEAVWAENPIEAIPYPEKRPSLRPDRPMTLVSPSVGRRMKGQRGINGKWHQYFPKTNHAISGELYYVHEVRRARPVTTTYRLFKRNYLVLNY